MNFSLPAHLHERARWFVEPQDLAKGDFVLYWMHHAVRGHENPALDVAICLARQSQLPLLVYHAICEEYPFASDRHHCFMLQGARDVQRDLGNLGIRYAFHLQRENHRGPHLRELTKQAAVLVTDEMPLVPIICWLDRLRATTAIPIATVDTSCVVPALLVNQCFTRAFEFRNATKLFRDSRVTRAYQTQAADCRPFAGTLPFDPLDLQHADLRELIGTCRIDHTIAPIVDTPGGSRAGYARWEQYKQTGLRTYAKRRNDAADQQGVSRLSAYLHYGMVSPFRIAREAAELGAEKFLDELLVWRELAFHFCFHKHETIDSLHAIPDWAQGTLADHQPDCRVANHSWESLARAKTAIRLWDACQRSLFKHGELHNNLRMTWGKAFLALTDTPARALQLAIDLNHRYALDGRDPSSYGGLLWCFGQFDRPFQPEQPIYGTVRPRSLDVHEERIDMTKYSRVADRSICPDNPRIAIVGAGFAGLVAARTLVDHGLQVELFEKSRGVGGRMATRRTPATSSTLGLSFDHGAQYFTARDEQFARHVHSWIQDGIVAPWFGRIVQLKNGEIIADKADTPRYVAVPGMNALPRHFATGLAITLNCSIKELQPLHEHDRHQWRLVDESGVSRGDFDIVIANCPPAQSGALLGTHTPLSQSIASISMLPCWASMMIVPQEISLEFDAAFVESSPLSWICRNDSKPGRQVADGSTWVLHATSDWSQTHLEWQPEAVEPLLHDAFREATGLTTSNFVACGTHRWRYAIPQAILSNSCLWDSTTRLGACGDWCGGPRVEGAFLSGAAMAGAILRDLTIDRKMPTETSHSELLF